MDDGEIAAWVAENAGGEVVRGGNRLGMTARAEGRLTDAAACFSWVVDRVPDSVSARNNLAGVLLELGRAAEAGRLYAEVLDRDPNAFPAASNRAFAACYDPAMTGDDVFALHRAWNDRFAVPLKRLWTPHPRRGEGRVRVGYLSSDLCNHPVGRYLLPVLERHDRDGFAVTCYATGGSDDATRAALKAAAEAWVDAAGWPPEDLAARIRADGIDVLVDLSGHTAPANMLALACKPAPVQVSWAGYPFSTGLDAMDYLLVDRHQVPPEAHRWCSEEVVELPEETVCWRPPDGAPEIAPRPPGPIVFGAFNALSKLNPALLRLWAKTLDAVPGSRLVVKTGGFSDPGTRALVEAEMAAAGLGPKRATLVGQTDQVGHLDAIAGVDIALDSHPYSGGATTLEALWMGVPTVTKAGATYFSRHAETHLFAVGLGDLVARDDAGFVARARDLAGDPTRLASLRASLRARVEASAARAEAAFTRNLEKVYRTLWTRYLDA